MDWALLSKNCQALLVFSASLLGYFLVFLVLRRAFIRNAGTLLETFLARTRFLVPLILSVYTTMQVIELGSRSHQLIYGIFVFMVFIQLAYWGSGLIKGWFAICIKKSMTVDPAQATSLGVLQFISILGFYAILTMAALTNLGVNITALLAGLGVGGIAIALALQNIVSDLFASLSIVLDKPFVVGDFISMGDAMGEVIHIGLKTTRLKSLSGEQLIVANSDLLRMKLRNYRRMENRRANFEIRISLSTRSEKLRQIPEHIEQIIRSTPKVRFERCTLREFTDSALLFEAVYFVLSPDYLIYAATHEQILFTILEWLEKNGIEFGVPVRKLVTLDSGRDQAAHARNAELRA